MTALLQVPAEASAEEITDLCDQAARHPARARRRPAGPAKILTVTWEDKEGKRFGGRIR